MRKQAWQECPMIWFYGRSSFLEVSSLSRSAILTVGAAASGDPTLLWSDGSSARFQRESRLLEQMPDATRVNTLGGKRGESAPRTKQTKKIGLEKIEKREAASADLCAFLLLYLSMNQSLK